MTGILAFFDRHSLASLLVLAAAIVGAIVSTRKQRGIDR